jgi:hypothetical protein
MYIIDTYNVCSKHFSWRKSALYNKPHTVAYQGNNVQQCNFIHTKIILGSFISISLFIFNNAELTVAVE